MAAPSYPSGHRARKVLGFYHRCRSVLDGAPIVLVLTGFRRGSKNAKTGTMIQSWILPERVDPQLATITGQDRSVCGSCPRRPRARQELPGGPGDCYVTVSRAPLTVWRAYRAGRYVPLDLEDLSTFHGRKLRIGSYGDPVAVPCDVWDRIIAGGRLAGWTGYTHAWRHPQAVNFQRMVMASVDTIPDHAEALRGGWRTFRVRPIGGPVLPTERICPASEEAGHRTTCATCGACNGAGGHRVIQVHGFRVANANGNGRN